MDETAAAQIIHLQKRTKRRERWWRRQQRRRRRRIPTTATTSEKKICSSSTENDSGHVHPMRYTHTHFTFVKLLHGRKRTSQARHKTKSVRCASGGAVIISFTNRPVAPYKNSKRCRRRLVLRHCSGNLENISRTAVEHFESQTHKANHTQKCMHVYDDDIYKVRTLMKHIFFLYRPYLHHN